MRSCAPPGATSATRPGARSPPGTPKPPAKFVSAMIDSGVVNATQDTASSWLGEGRRFVQALLVDVEGSAPLPVGAMMIVDEHGNIEGSITGGCVEGAVVQEAEQ